MQSKAKGLFGPEQKAVACCAPILSPSDSLELEIMSSDASLNLDGRFFFERVIRACWTGLLTLNADIYGGRIGRNFLLFAHSNEEGERSAFARSGPKVHTGSVRLIISAIVVWPSWEEQKITPTLYIHNEDIRRERQWSHYGILRMIFATTTDSSKGTTTTSSSSTVSVIATISLRSADQREESSLSHELVSMGANSKKVRSNILV